MNTNEKPTYLIWKSLLLFLFYFIFIVNTLSGWGGGKMEEQ